jgi:hypothetical protein
MGGHQKILLAVAPPRLKYWQKAFQADKAKSPGDNT